MIGNNANTFLNLNICTNLLVCRRSEHNNIDIGWHLAYIKIEKTTKVVYFWLLFCKEHVFQDQGSGIVWRYAFFLRGSVLRHRVQE